MPRSRMTPRSTRSGGRRSPSSSSTENSTRTGASRPTDCAPPCWLPTPKEPPREHPTHRPLEAGGRRRRHSCAARRADRRTSARAARRHRRDRAPRDRAQRRLPADQLGCRARQPVRGCRRPRALSGAPRAPRGGRLRAVGGRRARLRRLPRLSSTAWSAADRRERAVSRSVGSSRAPARERRGCDLPGPSGARTGARRRPERRR
ncbi:hypothetical protein COLO4_01247, partial [Corchorus olitorius]